ncbi:enoyl-CoA hydratase-related protein, partial [Rhodovulum sp.]|uniref:enoyl-CoA hydratase-related protein n=1 Tax=Rhodovulum sp. TaxID=34009 RepID=UPI001834517F
MAEFHYAVDAQGVASITWDVPGRSMNVMSLAGFHELDAHIDAALADPAVKGVVITSAKKDFAGGMDLNVITRMRDEAGDDPARGLFEGVMAMHGVLRKIERAGMDERNKGG